MIQRVLGKKKAQPQEDWHPPQHEAAHAPADDESNWLVSYADMMTLLCGFFIMMFSMAKLDEPKFEGVRQEVAKAFGGKYIPPSTNELSKITDTVIKELGIEKQT